MSAPAGAGAGNQTWSHPEWFGPHGFSELYVHNSLTGDNKPFVPMNGRQVRWYTCGPTVYDDSHLGHARSYVTFDILRRLMTDYFGYDVQFVMNITDLDDKIILKARRAYVYHRYIQSATLSSIISDGQSAFTHAITLLQTRITTLQEKRATQHKRFHADTDTMIQGETFKLEAVKKDAEEFNKIAAKADDSSRSRLLELSKSVLSEQLDRKEGHTVTDHSIYKAHTQKYENSFFDDMKRLNVREPDAITRVTEYIPQIITFIEKIISNGYAYLSNGSVYFDCQNYGKKHDYAKLTPWNVGNTELAAEGEGALSSTNGNEKKHENDFALWKQSKSGEPRWNSPWGEGRPGWHIECSVMASDILGERIDIHSGGVDLMFPHHDNEIAQSEACFESKQWINHFWHNGHLHIKGLKMSKSLKNFITIKELLQRHTGRQIRMLFLLAPWDGSMNYSDESLTEATTREKQFNEFFLNIAGALRTRGGLDANSQLWDDADREYHAKIMATKKNVHTAICNNFNNPEAIAHMIDLVGATNKYLKAQEATFKTVLLRQSAQYVDRILRIYGVMPDIEWGFGSSTGSDAQQQAFIKLVDAFANFRTQVRDVAMEMKQSQLLSFCDHVRDEILPALGVRLEDKGKNQPAIWKLVDPAELLKEREEKKAQEQEKKLQKLKNGLTERRKKLDKFPIEIRQPAKTHYATLTKEYSKWDADGKPTHDASGAALSNSKIKSLAKDFVKHDKLHAEYTTTVAKDPHFFTTLEREVQELEAQIKTSEA